MTTLFSLHSVFIMVAICTVFCVFCFFFYLTVLIACMICLYYNVCDCHAFIKGNLLTNLLTSLLGHHRPVGLLAADGASTSTLMGRQAGVSAGSRSREKFVGHVQISIFLTQNQHIIITKFPPKDVQLHATKILFVADWVRTQGFHCFGRKQIQEFSSPILEFSRCFRS